MYLHQREFFSDFARALCDKIALLATSDVDIRQLIGWLLMENFLTNDALPEKYKRGAMEIESTSPSYLSKVIPTKLRSFISVILSLVVS